MGGCVVVGWVRENKFIFRCFPPANNVGTSVNGVLVSPLFGGHNGRAEPGRNGFGVAAESRSEGDGVYTYVCRLKIILSL